MFVFETITLVHSYDGFIKCGKVVPHAKKQPVHLFTSHQQFIYLNNWQNIQSVLNKVKIIQSSLNDQATVQSVYRVIETMIYWSSSDYTKIKSEM